MRVDCFGEERQKELRVVVEELREDEGLANGVLLVPAKTDAGSLKISA